MATRQEAIDANAQHLAQVHKQFPEEDMETFRALQERTIHFKFDVKVPTTLLSYPTFLSIIDH